MPGRPLRRLDSNEIRQLYDYEGLTVSEIAEVLHTSLTTLYREWPEDLPRRKWGNRYTSRGPTRTTESLMVHIRRDATPNEVVGKLIRICDPDDLQDVADGIYAYLYEQKFPRLAAKDERTEEVTT